MVKIHLSFGKTCSYWTKWTTPRNVWQKKRVWGRKIIKNFIQKDQMWNFKLEIISDVLAFFQARNTFLTIAVCNFIFWLENIHTNFLLTIFIIRIYENNTLSLKENFQIFLHIRIWPFESLSEYLSYFCLNHILFLENISQNPSSFYVFS